MVSRQAAALESGEFCLPQEDLWLGLLGQGVVETQGLSGSLSPYLMLGAAGT